MPVIDHTIPVKMMAIYELTSAMPSSAATLNRRNAATIGGKSVNAISAKVRVNRRP